MTRSSAERPTYRVQVLERAVDILQVLSEDSRELTAGEVADKLDLHKNTIHRRRAHDLSSIPTARTASPEI